MNHLNHVSYGDIWNEANAMGPYLQANRIIFVSFTVFHIKCDSLRLSALIQQYYLLERASDEEKKEARNEK